MKRMTAFLCLIIVLSLFMGSAISAHANSIPSSLTIKYQHSGLSFDGLSIKIYRVADCNDNTLSLAGVFKDLPVNVKGVTSQTEWKAVTDTLVSYTAADGLSPDKTVITDKDGTASFKNIPDGMYLILAVTAEKDSVCAEFESFLTVVKDGEDTVAIPKGVPISPEGGNDGGGGNTPGGDKPGGGDENGDIPEGDTTDKSSHTLVKQWRDEGFSHKRPVSLEIVILKNNEKYATVSLTRENNWSYSWTDNDTDARFTAVERNVPDGYTVTVSETGGCLIITNTYKNTTQDIPQTGDTTLVWPYVLVTCASGILSLLLALYRKKLNDEKA